MCYINPRVDFAFKKLFGSEENKDLLISLINAIVAEEDQVYALELRNPYNLGRYKADKMSILDIKATNAAGHWFNIEMQMSQDLNFDRRALYYWSKVISDQLGEGMIYTEIKKTISINILNFNLIPNRHEFHNRYRIMNVATGTDDNLHDVFDLYYIELQKFSKQYDEIANALDRWLIFLTRAHEMKTNNIPQAIQSDVIITKAIEAVDRMFNEDERKIYDIRRHAMIDVASQIYSAKEEGLAKGREEGLEEGRKEGIEEGRKEGIEKGIKEGLKEARKAMVIKAAQTGMPIVAIAEMFDLPQEQVEEWLDN
ncbi:MAG: Rpn family recombination-promoting nuclease/putative transposase [Mariprofundales bacterium]